MARMGNQLIPPLSVSSVESVVSTASPGRSARQRLAPPLRTSHLLPLTSNLSPIRSIPHIPPDMLEHNAEKLRSQGQRDHDHSGDEEESEGLVDVGRDLHSLLETRRKAAGSPFSINTSGVGRDR